MERSQREPTESSDPMYNIEEEVAPPVSAWDAGPPVMTRSMGRTRAVGKVAEGSESTKPPQNTEKDANFENLQDMIHEVILEDKEVFPPLDFIGADEGTSVDRASPTPTGHAHDTPRAHPPASSPPKPKLRRKSSSLIVSTATLPKIDCPEKIFLCIDHSAELFANKFQTHSTTQTTVFRTLTNALKQFICTKSCLNKNHQFSLVMMNEDAQLITDFSSNYDELLFMLNDIAESPPQVDSSEMSSSTFDLSSLFSVLKQQAGLPRVNMKQAAKMPPAYIVRAIVIYGRSTCHPRFNSGQKNFALLNNSPFFFLDAVYIHEPLDEDNEVEEIFSDICSLDARGSSHIHEVGVESNMASLYNIFAKLLAHPLQRPKQGENILNYNLEME